MALSDFYPQLKGWVPAPSPQQSQQPQVPVSEVQNSPYLRATLPLPLQYAPDTLKQYNRPGLSSFRIAPLPPNASPALNSASTSATTSTVQEFISTAAAGSDGYVQFNASGGLGGSPFLFWSNSTSTLSVSNLVISNLLSVIYGGTGANLSATGGAHNVVQQLSAGAAFTVAQLAATDLSNGVTGTGLLVLQTSPTLITPVLGVAAATSVDASSGYKQGGTATSGHVLRGNGTNFVDAALAAADLSNGATGTGSVVLGTSPTLTTPNIGAATATSVNSLTFPAAAGSSVVAQRIASGTAALGTTAIGATSSASTVTVSASGVATTDSIRWAFNAAPGTGYTSGLFVQAYVTSGNVNFIVTNPTAGSLTPAAATLNWTVVR